MLWGGNPINSSPYPETGEGWPPSVLILLNIEKNFQITNLKFESSLEAAGKEAPERCNEGGKGCHGEGVEVNGPHNNRLPMYSKLG